MLLFFDKEFLRQLRPLQLAHTVIRVFSDSLQVPICRPGLIADESRYLNEPAIGMFAVASER